MMEKSPDKASHQPLVELYSKKDCHLCEAARMQLLAMRRYHAFELREYHLAPSDPRDTLYRYMYPVILIDGAECCHGRVDPAQFILALQLAAQRG